VLLEGRLPDAVAFGTASVVAVVTFLGAWLVFHRAEFQFAERA
jgi:hypothetical protein